MSKRNSFESFHELYRNHIKKIYHSPIKINTSPNELRRAIIIELIKFYTELIEKNPFIPNKEKIVLALQKDYDSIGHFISVPISQSNLNQYSGISLNNIKSLKEFIELANVKEVPESSDELKKESNSEYIILESPFDGITMLQSMPDFHKLDRVIIKNAFELNYENGIFLFVMFPNCLVFSIHLLNLYKRLEYLAKKPKGKQPNIEVYTKILAVHNNSRLLMSEATICKIYKVLPSSFNLWKNNNSLLSRKLIEGLSKKELKTILKEFETLKNRYTF